ncbi:Transcriptional regulator NRG1 [Yarrowia sp. C11]|nr:Transcriptional regulator NRG1 [Yarrowia sp. E02]KAG5371576.1 Transcriptional regulator NRG1 [Yarrowia sp. C11]
MSLKYILNDQRPLPPIRYINYPPTPPMYHYQPQQVQSVPPQQQCQILQTQIQPVVHAQPMMQVAPPPPPPSAHVHSYAPPSLPQSPPLYQPQTVPIVNVNLNNAHNKKRKKYMCDCGRSFTTSGHLARHMRIHTGEKNYQCPYEGCTSRFSRQDNCMQHYRTHLGTSRNSMMRRKSGTVSPPPGQVSKPQKQDKTAERKMSNFLSTVLVT